MPKAFYHEQSVTVDGETLRLVINFRALDAIEGVLDRSFEDVLTELTRKQPKPRLGTIGPVLWGLLQEHQPTITLDEAASLLFGEAGSTVGLALGKLVEAAFIADDGKERPKNPRKRRGASKPS